VVDELLRPTGFRHHVRYRFPPLKVVRSVLVRRRGFSSFVNFDEHELRFVVLVLQHVEASDPRFLGRFPRVLQRRLPERVFGARLRLDEDVDCCI